MDAIEEILAADAIEESEDSERAATRTRERRAPGGRHRRDRHRRGEGERLRRAGRLDRRGRAGRGSRRARRQEGEDAEGAEGHARTPRPVFASKSEALVHRVGGADGIVLEASDADLSETDRQAKNDAFLASVNTTAKKVQEKVINIMASAAKGVKLSAFTDTALRVLLTKGSVTSKDIFEAMITDDWTVGTARSQSQQMMQLLPLVRIANRSKDVLTVNPDSVLAEHFKATLFA